MVKKVSLMLVLIAGAWGFAAPAAAGYKLALLMAEQDSTGAEVLNSTTAAFFDSKRFEVIERDQLGKIFQERDLADFIQGTAGDLGSLNGVDMIGVVTYSQEPILGPAGAPVPGFFINVRLTDVKTGKVVGSVTSRREDVFRMPTSVHLASRLLLENVREMFPPEGSVLAVSAKEVVVSLGAGDGIKVNDQLEVVQEGEVYFDAEGKAFAPMEEVVGTLKVTQVGPQLSKTKLRKGEQAITVGARVRLKKSGEGRSAMDYILPVVRTLVRPGSR